jgi:hypothetical protein
LKQQTRRELKIPERYGKPQDKRAKLLMFSGHRGPLFGPKNTPRQTIDQQYYYKGLFPEKLIPI